VTKREIPLDSAHRAEIEDKAGSPVEVPHARDMNTSARLGPEIVAIGRRGVERARAALHSARFDR
jgi:hypothetical protein